MDVVVGRGDGSVFDAFTVSAIDHTQRAFDGYVPITAMEYVR